MAHFTQEELEALKAMGDGETVSTRIEGREMIATYQGSDYRFPLILTLDKVNNLPDMEDNPIGFIEGVADSDISGVSAMAMSKVIEAYGEAFALANGIQLGES